LYKQLLQPLLFALDAERAHRITFAMLKLAYALPPARWLLKQLYYYRPEALACEVAGIRFPSRVGIAAGLDKNAEIIRPLGAIGVGFVEIGTVTPRPQAGNDRPRLFRLKPDRAIINRMGFNNEGMEAVVQRLKRHKGQLVIGGNIGKNKITPNEQAIDDYLACYEALQPWVDYFVVNVSSPNTPNLRDLQEKEPLKHLLHTLQNVNLQQPSPKPIFLKIAPDLSDTQLSDIVEVVQQTGIAGVIATNTTISREGLQTSPTTLTQIGAGGLSGRPLRQRATEVIRYLRQALGAEVALIGVGGIHSPQDALEKLEAGADLVQVYTGFVYEGPMLIKQIHKALAHTKPIQAAPAQ
jgi:dihydroorotate dehydrogenase